MRMLDVVVKREFRDRYTGLKHKPGDKLKVTDGRYREIMRSGAGYIEAVKAEAKKEK